MPADPAQTPNYRARRLALGLSLLVLGAVIALAISSAAPAQDATSELGAKMDELESNVDQQGSLQATIDRQNAEINDLIARESDLRRKADAVQSELDQRQAELDQATEQLNAEKAHLAEVRAQAAARDRHARAAAGLDLQVRRPGHAQRRPPGRQLGGPRSAESEYFARVENYDEAVVERVTGLREEIEQSVVCSARSRSGSRSRATRSPPAAPSSRRPRPRSPPSTPSSSPRAPSARRRSRRSRRARRLSRTSSEPRFPAPASRGRSSTARPCAAQRPARRQGRDRGGQPDQRAPLHLGRRPRIVRGLGL